MKYILIDNLFKATEVDDGMFFVKAEVAGDTDRQEATMEFFSEGDMFHIKRRKPPEANAIALTDDWMYYDTENGMLFGYVFK